MGRLIDANALKEAFYRKMKELLLSTDTPQISYEALSLLCGASLIADAPTIELRCEECEAFNKTRLLIPQPERKTGHIVVDHNSEKTFCSVCGSELEGCERIEVEHETD